MKKLDGKRVMIVEDEFLVSIQVEDILISAGCEIIGPFCTITQGLEAARRNQFDFAVLDVNVNKELSFPIAEVLDQRHIPFILVTGYDRHIIPDLQSHWHILSKPFRRQELLNAVAGVTPWNGQDSTAGGVNREHPW